MAPDLMPHGTTKARSHQGQAWKCVLLGALLCGISALLTGPAWGKAGDILGQREIDRATDSDQANALAAEGNRAYVAVAGPAYLVQAYDGENGGVAWPGQAAFGGRLCRFGPVRTGGRRGGFSPGAPPIRREGVRTCVGP